MINASRVKSAAIGTEVGAECGVMWICSTQICYELS